MYTHTHMYVVSLKKRSGTNAVQILERRSTLAQIGPSLVEQIRPNSARVARNRPTFNRFEHFRQSSARDAPNSDRVRRNSNTAFARSLPNLQRNGPTLARMRPFLTRIRRDQHWLGIGYTCPNLSKSDPKSARFGAMSAKSDQQWTGHGQIWPDFGRHCPEFDQNWPDIEQLSDPPMWTGNLQVWPGEAGRDSFGSTLVEQTWSVVPKAHGTALQLSAGNRTYRRLWTSFPARVRCRGSSRNSGPGSPAPRAVVREGGVGCGGGRDVDRH